MFNGNILEFDSLIILFYHFKGNILVKFYSKCYMRNRLFLPYICYTELRINCSLLKPVTLKVIIQRCASTCSQLNSKECTCIYSVAYLISFWHLDANSSFGLLEARQVVSSVLPQ